MDGWQPEPQRHKRSFTEMSHSATLSPSPMSFMGPASFFSAPRFPSSSANENLERRRTSHPHNSYLQPRASEEMSDRLQFQQQQQRPRLEHRASQTIIDLTDEPEESPASPRDLQPRNRPPRPPQLGRSDAVNLGDLIDLTDDSMEQEVIFTGERQLPAQAARPRPRARVVARAAAPSAVRPNSPSLFLPAGNPPAMNPGRLNGLVPHGMAFGDLLGGFDEPRAGLGPGLGFGRFPRDFMDQLHMAQMVQNAQAQAMPHGLDYQHVAFAEQKPEHVPPPAARPGFTRSTKEDHVLVCPSCEEELIQNNEVEEPVARKSGKLPSKKEREEHPFWVVKDCGHVYCNACFQVRASSGKTGFKESAKAGKKAKTFTCAVEDCDSDIKTKEKWVGVFL